MRQAFFFVFARGLLCRDLNHWLHLVERGIGQVAFHLVPIGQLTYRRHLFLAETPGHF